MLNNRQFYAGVMYGITVIPMLVFWIMPTLKLAGIDAGIAFIILIIAMFLDKNFDVN